jgi:hypothetical protein
LAPVLQERKGGGQSSRGGRGRQRGWYVIAASTRGPSHWALSLLQGMCPGQASQAATSITLAEGSSQHPTSTSTQHPAPTWLRGGSFPPAACPQPRGGSRSSWCRTGRQHPGSPQTGPQLRGAGVEQTAVRARTDTAGRVWRGLAAAQVAGVAVPWGGQYPRGSVLPPAGVRGRRQGCCCARGKRCGMADSDATDLRW